MAGPTFEKDPQATLDFSVDWATNFNSAGSPTPTISTSSWTVPSGLTQVSASVNGDNTVATVVVSGGAAGTVYELVNHIIRSDTLEDDRSIYIYVRSLPSATYSGNPSNSTRDQVRFLLRDTDMSSPILTDAEIDWLLTEEPNVYLAAASAAEQVTSRFANLADKQVGDLRISYRNQVRDWDQRATALRKRGVIRSALPYAGGISRDDKRNVELDTDRVKPSFAIGMHDNPDVKRMVNANDPVYGHVL
jgi:hypothetical protein